MGIPGEDILISHENVGVLQNGVLTFSWNGDQVLKEDNDNDLSFVMTFKVTTPGSLREKLVLSNAVTIAEAYTVTEEVLDVELLFDDSQKATDFALYQNRPNPWQGHTLIGFDLPESGIATMTVYDVAGKVLKTISGDYEQGYNTIILTNKDLITSGVLYYRLDFAGYSATKKMMIIH